MSDIIERLRGYNPPDRAVDSDYQVAKDIHDALEEIQRLQNQEEIQRLQNQLNNARIKLTEFMDTKKPQTAFEKLTALETVLKDYKSQDNV